MCMEPLLLGHARKIWHPELGEIIRRLKEDAVKLLALKGNQFPELKEEILGSEIIWAEGDISAERWMIQKKD